MPATIAAVPAWRRAPARLADGWRWVATLAEDEHGVSKRRFILKSVRALHLERWRRNREGGIILS